MPGYFSVEKYLRPKGLLIMIDPGVSGRRLMLIKTFSSSRRTVMQILPPIIETHFGAGYS